MERTVIDSGNCEKKSTVLGKRKTFLDSMKKENNTDSNPSK